MRIWFKFHKFFFKQNVNIYQQSLYFNLLLLSALNELLKMLANVTFSSFLIEQAVEGISS